MALADYRAERREIKLQGGSFTVGGVSLEALSQLINGHLPEMTDLFDATQETLDSGKIDEVGLEGIAVAIVKGSPDLSAAIIALAAGEYTEAAIKSAKTLPFPTQIDILINIGELTFSEVGGVGKTAERITTLLKNMNIVSHVPQLNLPLSSSTTD